MFLNGVYNNKNPSTIYSDGRTIQDIETIFRKAADGDVNVDKAEKLSTIAGAHRIITNSIGSLPVMILQKKENERHEADHNLKHVLKMRANPYMTPYMVKKTMISQGFWHGMGFCYIERNKSGQVINLIPLPSAGHTNYIDPSTGTLWYAFSIKSGTPFDKDTTRKFTESELLIYRFESYDGYNGRGILDLAKQAIATDYMAQDYGGKFYKNGARVSGIVEVPAELDEEAKDIVRMDFERMAHGMDNAWRTAVLDMGMKYTQLGISQRDSQYLETREFTVNEISRFTGIPAYMLQGGKQSYQSNEQQQLDFVMNTLTPHLVQIEQEWTYKLFTTHERDDGYYIKLNEAALLRGDNAARANYYQRMVGLGVYNQDECRALEDMSPLPDGRGSQYWMSKNYDTIENIMKGDDGTGNKVKRNNNG